MEMVPAADLFIASMLEMATQTDGTKKKAKELADDGSVKEWAMGAATAAGFVVDALDGVVRVAKLTGRALAGIGKDIETFSKVAFIAAGAGFTEEGQAAIKELVSSRNAFIAEMNADMSSIVSAPQFSEGLGKRMDEYKENYAAYTAQVKLVKKAYEEAGASADVVQGAVSRLHKAMLGDGWEYANGKLAGALKSVKETAHDAAKALENLHITQMALVHKQASAELDEITKAQAEYNKSVEAMLGPLEQQATQLERQVENYGLAESAIQSTLVARLEEARAIAEANGAYPEHLAFLDREIEARQRIGSASSQKEFLDANKKAAEQSAREWEKFGDEINRSLTDALMRGFEDGKSFGKNFVDSLTNSLKTSVLKIGVNVVTGTGASLLNAGINAVAGTSGNNGGSGTNYLGLASNANSAYNLYNGTYANYAMGAYSQYDAGLSMSAMNFGNYAPVTNAVSTTGTVAGVESGVGAAGAEAGGFSMAGIGAAAGYMAIMYAVFELLTTSKSRYLDTTISGSMGENGFSGTMTDRYKNTGNLINDGSIDSSTRLLSGNTTDISEFLKQQAGFVDTETLVRAGYLKETPVRSFLKPDEPNYAEADIASARKAYLDAVGSGANPWDVKGGVDQVGFATNADYSRVLIDQAESGGIIKSAIESIYSATKMSLEGVAEQFDDNTVLDKLDNFSKEINIKFGGSIVDGLKTFGDTLAREMGSAWLPSIEGMRKSGEDWASALGRVIAESQAVSGVLDTMGKSMSDVFGKNNADNILRMSDSFVKLFGSVDVLSQSFDAYYQNFYTDAEKSARAMESLQKQFSVFGIALPETRESFRSLVEAQDLNTVSGQETFHALMTLQGAFANLVPAIDSVAASAESATDALMSQSQETQAQRIGAYLDAQRAAAMSSQEEILSQQESAAQASASSASAIADTFKRILDSLTDYRNSLFSGPESALSLDAQYEATRRIYGETAAKAKLGDVDAANKLQSVASDFLAASQKISTADGYAQDYGNVMGTLDTVIGVATRQVPIAEQQLTIAQAQLASLESIRAALSTAGALSTSGTLPVVVADYQQASKDWNSWFDTTAVGASQTFDIGTTKRLSENIGMLTDLLGNSYTFSRDEGFYGLADRSSVWAEEIKRRYGSLQSFDIGTNFVPFDMPAMIHRGERIVPAADNRRLLEAAEGNGALVTELRALREEVAMLRSETRATATHTDRIATAINRAMPDGDALATRAAA